MVQTINQDIMNANPVGASYMSRFGGLQYGNNVNNYTAQNSIFSTQTATADTFTAEELNGELDDGKISFGDKVKNFCKGIIKPVTSMFESPKNFLIGAATIAAGAGLIAITGGAAAPLMVAAGVVGGGIQFAKGAINASKATTDAEAEAAWQDMGTGTFAVGASVLGAKSSLKAAGYADDVANMNALQATGKCFTTAPKQLSASWTNATTKVSSFLGSVDDASKLADDAIQAEAKARTEAEALEKAAVEKNNAALEENWSHKSAKESARVFEEARRKEVIAHSKSAKSNSATAKNVRQGMNNAPDEVLQTKVDAANKAAIDADDSAKFLKEVATEQPTHQNKLNAQRAHNNATKAQLEAAKTEAKAAQVAQQRQQAAKVKAENVAKMESSPGYEQGQIKMEQNAAKTTKNAAVRQQSAFKSKPGYQRQFAKLKQLADAGKTDVAKSIAAKAAKSGNQYEAAAAQDFLASLA